MIKILFLTLVFVLLAQFAFSNDLSVEIKQPDGSTITQSLIEFINEGKKKMSNTGCQKKAIMVLGLTGVGKSTLVNYLNDVPLKCEKINGDWRIDLVDPNVTLMCKFKIGHRDSETLYPSACTPDGKQVTYIDSPGFQDNRGFEIEIGNSFFREEILKQVDDLKFLILLNFADVIDRRVQFFDTVQRLSDFVGLFEHTNENELKKLAKSIGIIVSKVNNDGDSDEEVRTRLNDFLLQSLKTNKILNPNETIVFRHVLQNNQLELFSNPRIKKTLDNVQKDQMLNMINTKMDYVRSKDARIRVRIDRSHLPKLNAYIIDNYEKFEINLHNRLEAHINAFINGIIESEDLDVKNAMVLEKLLSLINENGIKPMEFDTFVSGLNEEFLSQEDRKQLEEAKSVLDYFINLLSDDFRRTFPSERTWLSVNLLSKLNELITSKVNTFIMDENKKFHVAMVSVLSASLSEFAVMQIKQAQDVYQAKQIQRHLNAFSTAHLGKENVNELFIASLNADIITYEVKEALMAKQKTLGKFNDLLPNELKQRLTSREYLIELGVHVSNIVSELNVIASYEEHSFDNGIFVYKSYFARLSSILSLIENAANVVSLRSVQVFAANAVLIDVDFKVNSDRYGTANSPDLVIVAPKVKFNPRLTIDLSSYVQMRYPNGRSKAPNGNGFGGSGQNGLPGLPGYNGGKLYVLAEEILGEKDFSFKSKGGNGGPGQNGGDGTEGEQGQNGLYSEDANISAGKPGSKGGNAGKGGAGGLGGYPGGYVMVNVANKEVRKAFSPATNDIGAKGENGLVGEPGLGGLYGATAQETKKSEQVKKRSVHRERRGGGGGTRVVHRDVIKTVTVEIPKYINTNIVRNMIPSNKRAPPGDRPSTLNSENLKLPTDLEQLPIRPMFDNYLVHFPTLKNKIKIQTLLDASLFEKFSDSTYVNEILDLYDNVV